MTNSKEIDRFALAAKLESILGADLDDDEQDAIEQAIRIICPGYMEACEQHEQDAADWFDSHTPEQRAAFVAEMKDKHVPKIPEQPDGNMVPFRKE